MRPWFRTNSLILAPLSHPVHEEVRRAASKTKKYGAVKVPTGAGPEDYSVVEMVKRSMDQVREFVGSRLPTEEVGDEVDMAEA